jgi:Right handed beta helix region
MVALGAATAVAVTPVSIASAAPAVPAIVTVSTSTQLQSALDAAVSGQVIELQDGTYTGAFRSSRSGTKAAPITLRGSRDAVLTTGALTGPDAALTLSGKAWTLAGFTVSTSPTGVVLSNSDNSVLDDLGVTSIGARGIHIRRNSAYVTVRNALITDTGLATPGAGEGVYVGSARADWAAVTGAANTPDRSDYVRIEKTSFVNTAAEGVDLREGTTGGRVAWNIFDNTGHSGTDSGDSWVDVRANSTSVWANAGFSSLSDAFQVHAAAGGWGTGNRFRDNVVMENVPGFEVNAVDVPSGTVVYCTYSNAAKGLSNIPCTDG